MMNKNKFCALGSLYNGETPSNLRQSLESVFSQSSPVPVILVIDGPISEDLEKIVREFENDIHQVLKLPENLGLGPALNAGINQIKEDFDYVIRFDTDDINLPTRFASLMRAVDERGLDLVGSHMDEFIDNHMQPDSTRFVPLDRHGILKGIFWRCPFNHPSVLFRIESVREVGGYENVPFFEDWYLWGKMLAEGKAVGNIDKSLVLFRSGKRALARRRGLSYAKNEFSFFKKLYSLNLPGRWAASVSLTLRLITRFLPERLFEYVYFFSRKVKK